LISLSLVNYTGNIYAGLIYPIAIAILTAAVNVLCLPRPHEVHAEELVTASMSGKGAV
jgi:hypothetical protein